MTAETGEYRGWAIPKWVRTVCWGTDDSRIRATWRVLLALPVFWVLAGAVFAGNLQARIDVIPSGGEPLGGVAASLLHGGFVVLALAAWASYLDRRPLSAYGVSASWSWGRELLVGLGGVFAAFGIWFGVVTAFGWASVGVAPAASVGSLLIGLGLFIVALGIHVWIQQVVFFRIIMGNAAEGLYSRGLPARLAILGGIIVAVPIFIGIHQVSIDLRLLDLAVVGLLYGLLYAHTGELALGIGLHLGIFVVDQALVAAPSDTTDLAVFEVTTELPEAIAVLGAYGFPKMVIAYGLVVTYLAWSRGGVGVEPGIARVNDR